VGQTLPSVVKCPSEKGPYLTRLIGSIQRYLYYFANNVMSCSKFYPASDTGSPIPAIYENFLTKLQQKLLSLPRLLERGQ
jgi:hypothetical protein